MIPSRHGKRQRLTHLEVIIADSRICEKLPTLMQSGLSSFSHVLLAINQHLNLLANFVQSPDDLAIAIRESQNRIRNTCIRTKLPNHDLRLAEVMARNSWKQVVNGLELQTTMDKVQPSRAINIEGCSQLSLGERLIFSQGGGGHTPVGKSNLDMQRHSNDVRDEDECDPDGPCGQSMPKQ